MSTAAYKIFIKSLHISTGLYHKYTFCEFGTWQQNLTDYVISLQGVERP